MCIYKGSCGTFGNVNAISFTFKKLLKLNILLVKAKMEKYLNIMIDYTIFPILF